MSGVSDFKIQDNSAAVKQQMSSAVKRALTALGITAVEVIAHNMDSGYSRPIWDTGSLHRDVHYKVEDDGKTVSVGNSLEYAPFVHEGTRRMNARPYIKDALLNSANQQAFKEVVKEQLSRG